MRRFLTFISGDGPPHPDPSGLHPDAKPPYDDDDDDPDLAHLHSHNIETKTKHPSASTDPDTASTSTPPPSPPSAAEASETDETHIDHALSSPPPVNRFLDDAPHSPVSAASESPATAAALRLRGVVAVLRGYADEAGGAVLTPHVIAALKDLAETMVWADQNDPNVWDVFLEFAVMPLLVRCLRVSAKPIEAQDVAEARQAERREAARDGVDPEQVAHDDEEEDYDREFANIPSGTGNAIAGEDSRPSRVMSGPASPSSSTDMSRRRGSAVSFSSIVEAESSTTERSVNAMANSAGELDETSVIDSGAEIQAQILQTISIVIQSVSRQQSLLCLFSSNHINDILSFDFTFEHDEMLAYFISAVKSIALKLDEGLLQLFFDPIKGSFPLYTAVTRFFDHPETMVRIAMRNVTLTIYALGDSEVLRFAAKDETHYFLKTVELLARLCGSVARAFELLLDDGREIRRTRSRTGIFRRRVKISELTAKLEEIENLCAYLGDVSTVSQAYLHPLVVNLISSRLFSPFFRPIASQASPASLQLLQKQWRLARSDSGTETKPALPLFDAAARSLVLTGLLTHCRSSPLGSMLVRDLCRPTSEFEHRHVLHGLKGMATNITGTERVTFISLCAIEAFISCEAASKQLLSSLKYDFFLDDSEEIDGHESDGTHKAFINIGIPDEDDLQRRGSEPLLMTLSDFEAPLTPTSSRPTTPTLPSNPSFDGMKTPPNGLYDSRMSSFDSSSGFNLSPPAEVLPVVERSNSDGILSSFQFGETSLREAISSIVLVVRRREVRTLRVIHAISRIITAVYEKTSDINSCVDVTKIMLDELAGVIHGFMKNKRTTIVSIEQMFDNFRAAAKDEDILPQDAMDLSIIVSPDRLPAIASDFPAGAGKRRRVHVEDATPPVEIEDAQTFCIMAHAYDETLRSAKVLGRMGSLSKQVLERLTESGVDDSYLDKREALEQVSEAVLKHGEVYT